MADVAEQVNARENGQGDQRWQEMMSVFGGKAQSEKLGETPPYTNCVALFDKN